MQIHEITQQKLNEGLGDIAKSVGQWSKGYGQRKINKQAASAAGKLSQQGYGANYQKASDKWEDKYAALQKDSSVNSYVKGLAAGWANNASKLVQPTQGLASSTTFQKMIPSLITAAKKSNNKLTSTQIGQLLAKSAPTIWQNTADKSTAISQLASELAKQGITVDGVSTAATTVKAPATKIPYGTAPGANSEPVFLGGKKLDPKNPNDAKTLAAMEKQGKLHEAALIGPASNQYKNAFIKWSDTQMASRVPETGDTVTMDQVRSKFPDLDTKLSQALNQIIQTQGTPQQTQAVEEYTKLAVAGIQALSQNLKNNISSTAAVQGAATTAHTATTKQALQAAGIDPNRLAQFGAAAKEAGSPMVARLQSDPTANNLLKLAGYTLR